MYPRRKKDPEEKYPPGCLEKNTRFISSVYVRQQQVRTNSGGTAVFEKCEQLLPSFQWQSGEPSSWLAPAEVGSFGAIPGEEHDRNKPDGSSFRHTMTFTQVPHSPLGAGSLCTDINKPQVTLPPPSLASLLPGACVQVKSSWHMRYFWNFHQ